jgi:DNA-binding response OmpR family regulator
VNIALAHMAHRTREKLAAAMRARGLQVYSVPDLAGVLDASAQAKLVLALVEPGLLLASESNLRDEIKKKSGNDVQIVALTNRYEEQYAAIFDRHGATMLEHDPEATGDIAAWAHTLATKLSTSGRDANTGQHWGPARKASSSRGVIQGANGPGPSILVVEDEPSFRMFLCDALGAQGYKVWAAENAEDALAFFENGHADLVMADINMPGMDGFELKQKIDLWKKAPVPFIIMTADSNAENAANASAVGVVFILGKPIRDLDALYAIVRETLRKAGVAVPSS